MRSGGTVETVDEFRYVSWVDGFVERDEAAVTRERESTVRSSFPKSKMRDDAREELTIQESLECRHS